MCWDFQLCQITNIRLNSIQFSNKTSLHISIVLDKHKHIEIWLGIIKLEDLNLRFTIILNNLDFVLGSRLPTDEDFAFLLEDRAFVDYFNIFITLPVCSTS